MMKKAILLGASLLFLLTGVHAQSLDDAKRAIDMEQFARAKGILENLVQKQPKKGENYFYLGQIHLVNEHLDSAKTVFSAGLEADRRNQLNNVGLGIVELFSGNSAAAERIFGEVSNSIKRRDYLELYAIGRAYIDAPEPDYGKALQYLNQALTRSGRRVDPLIHLAMGDAYYNAGSLSDAYVSYREAISLNPALTKAEVQMAVITRASRAWPETIEALQHVMDERPDYAPTYREMAETYNAWAFFATDTAVYRERNRTAVEYYKQYMDRTDYSVENRIRYADFLVYARDYDELHVQATELAQLEDVNPKILRYLGYSAYNKQDYTEAETALSRMLERMEEERVIARDYLFLGLVKLKNATAGGATNTALFDEGISFIRKAVEVDSASADDLSVTGREFMAANKFLEASKVFEISSGTEGSRNQVTDTYYFGLSSYFASASALNEGRELDRGLVQKADEAFVYVIDKAPELIEPYLYRARNQQLLDDRENPTGVANPYFEKYIEMVHSQGPEEVQKAKATLIELYNTMAYQNAMANNFDKAKELLEETFKLDPQNDYAQQVLTYVQQMEQVNAAGR